MLQTFLGRIRAPRYAQITISTENNKVTMHYTATHTDGNKVTYQREYDGEIIQTKLIMDLFSWLKNTANTFWGAQNGGL